MGNAADLDTRLRYSRSVDDLALLEPLWNALQDHHAEVLPELGDRTRPRALSDAWRHRRRKYERWLDDSASFFVIASQEGEPVGYAFVTVGQPFAGWATGRLAELETLSVIPGHRNAKLGERLLDAVWSRLGEVGIDEMTITAAISNVDSHRFYERHGFRQSFVVYYGKRGIGQ